MYIYIERERETERQRERQREYVKYENCQNTSYISINSFQDAIHTPFKPPDLQTIPNHKYVHT